ncbi:5-methyltetrahydropteroyltriglutamate--homocysteine methyltransferase [Halobacteriales archaeon QS_3_64_16]|nr:MAG: 5-methyltetrahydropteroyltriglutamate--homocysteine methyltransferase [Halobacteriales archaeon QS_3_64_16]
MTELLATTPGVYPLPDDAKTDLAHLKGHQKDDLVSGAEGSDVRNIYDRARETVLTDQRETGLDRVVEGQLRWDDMLAHPLCVHDAVDTRGIVRYYDNNNFYREPVVENELDFDGDLAGDLKVAAEIASTDSLQAVVPGPYSLADLAEDDFYGDETAFLEGIADFLVGEIEAFPDVETLFVLEPSLVVNPPEDGADERASEAISRVASATDAEVVVQTYWGALTEKVHAHLLDAEIDAVGYDFVSDHEANLYNISEYGTKGSIALGIVDGQNTLVEDPAKIDERIEWVREKSPMQAFDRIYVTPNTELFYLPVTKYREKLAALAEAVSPAEVSAT